MTVRWWAPLPLVLLIATGSDARGGTGKYVPAFSLDQIVEQRNLGQFVLSPDRTRVVFTRVGRYFAHPLFPAFGEDSNLTMLHIPTGEQVQLTSGTAAKTYPSFSPDGRLVAYESEGDIWTVHVDSGRTRRLTTSAGADRGAAWSPDGRQIAFVANRLGRAGILRDGRGRRARRPPPSTRGQFQRHQSGVVARWRLHPRHRGGRPALLFTRHLPSAR